MWGGGAVVPASQRAQVRAAADARPRAATGGAASTTKQQQQRPTPAAAAVPDWGGPCWPTARSALSPRRSAHIAPRADAAPAQGAAARGGDGSHRHRGQVAISHVALVASGGRRLCASSAARALCGAGLRCLSAATTAPDRRTARRLPFCAALAAAISGCCHAHTLLSSLRPVPRLLPAHSRLPTAPHTASPSSKSPPLSTPLPPASARRHEADSGHAQDQDPRGG